MRPDGELFQQPDARRRKRPPEPHPVTHRIKCKSLFFYHSDLRETPGSLKPNVNQLRVSLQITTSLDQMREFLSGTLLSVQQRTLCVERSLWEEAQQCVRLLKDKDLVTVTADSHGQTLQVTKLGKATYKGESWLQKFQFEAPRFFF